MVRLRPSNQVICLSAPCIAVALLVVSRRRRPSECHANYKVVLEVYSAHKIGCHGNVPWGIEKNNLRSFIYGQSSTNPAMFVKIIPVDVEINGLAEITKNIAI